MIEVPPTTFGPWIFNRDNLTLWLPAHQYEVDLERCLKPEEALDWLCHMQGKAWASAEVIGYLVEGMAGLLWGYGSNPHVISPEEAAEVFLENERQVLTSRLVGERMHEIQGPDRLRAFSMAELDGLERACRADVDARFAVADEAEITEDLLPSGLSIGDVYAIGLADGECPVGRVGRGYGSDEVVVYLYDWLTNTFGASLRIDGRQIRDVRHAVLLTDEQKAEQGYGDQMVFDMDPLAEFQNEWKRQHEQTEG